jgi:hypothetical protein
VDTASTHIAPEQLAAVMARLGMPVVPGKDGKAHSRWITRERPEIDRIACPWLVLRFIDPGAEFIYVPTDRVFAQAKRLNAVAYDIPGAPVTHEWELCSCDALTVSDALYEWCRAAKEETHGWNAHLMDGIAQ